MTFQLADFVFGGLRDLPGPVWISSHALQKMCTRGRSEALNQPWLLSDDGVQRGYLLRRDNKWPEQTVKRQITATYLHYKVFFLTRSDSCCVQERFPFQVLKSLFFCVCVSATRSKT